MVLALKKNVSFSLLQLNCITYRKQNILILNKRNIEFFQSKLFCVMYTFNLKMFYNF